MASKLTDWKQEMDLKALCASKRTSRIKTDFHTTYTYSLVDNTTLGQYVQV